MANEQNKKIVTTHSEIIVVTETKTLKPEYVREGHHTTVGTVTPLAADFIPSNRSTSGSIPPISGR